MDNKNGIDVGAMFRKSCADEEAAKAKLMITPAPSDGLRLTNAMLARGRWWDSYGYERDDHQLIDKFEAFRITDWKAEKGYTESSARICARTLTPKTRCKWLSKDRCPGCTNLGTLWDHQSMWRDSNGQLLLVLQPYLPSSGYMKGVIEFEDDDDQIKLLREFCELNDVSYKFDTEWSWHYPGWTTLIELRSLIPIPPKRQYGPQVDSLA